ncbi:uncharacterized protein BdWA1_004157 [Babesia duncani]|nr:hypothetical protein BdWA1_004157 [Babesia duncani]
MCNVALDVLLDFYALASSNEKGLLWIACTALGAADYLTKCLERLEGNFLEGDFFDGNLLEGNLSPLGGGATVTPENQKGLKEIQEGPLSFSTLDLALEIAQINCQNVFKSCNRCLGYIYSVGRTSIKRLGPSARALLNSRGVLHEYMEHHQALVDPKNKEDGMDSSLENVRGHEARQDCDIEKLLLQRIAECLGKGDLYRGCNVTRHLLSVDEASEFIHRDSRLLGWHKVYSMVHATNLISFFAWVEPSLILSSSDELMHKLIGLHLESIEPNRALCMHSPVEMEPASVSHYMESLYRARLHLTGSFARSTSLRDFQDSQDFGGIVTLTRPTDRLVLWVLLDQTCGGGQVDPRVKLHGTLSLTLAPSRGRESVGEPGVEQKLGENIGHHVQLKWGANRVEIDKSVFPTGTWTITKVALELKGTDGGQLLSCRIPGAIPLDFVSSVAHALARLGGCDGTPSLAVAMTSPEIQVREPPRVLFTLSNVNGDLLVHAGCRHFLRVRGTFVEPLQVDGGSLELVIRCFGQELWRGSSVTISHVPSLDYEWEVDLMVPQNALGNLECQFDLEGAPQEWGRVSEIVKVPTTLPFIPTNATGIEIECACTMLELISATFKDLKLISTPTMIPRGAKVQLGSVPEDMDGEIIFEYRVYRKKENMDLELVSPVLTYALGSPLRGDLLSVWIQGPHVGHVNCEMNYTLEFACNTRTRVDYKINLDPKWLIGGPMEAVGLVLDDANGFKCTIPFKLVGLVEGILSLPHFEITCALPVKVKGDNVLILPSQSQSRLL